MTLLVTGASGLLGASLIMAAAASRRPVVAASHSHPIRTVGLPAYQADLCEPDEARAIIERVQPTAIIHTAAATSVERCETDPAYAFRMNEAMARNVATAARAVGARMIHISTDAVFDGEATDGYTETAPTAPRNVYGRAKLAGEFAVLDVHPEALVVRTTIYGWNAQPKSSLAEAFVAKLRGGAPVLGFADAWMTPILANDLADCLLALLDHGTAGVLHIAGPECIAKADFARRIAVRFGFDPTLVTPISMQEAGLAAPRARRPCLRVHPAEAILGPMPSIDDGIDRFYRLEADGYRDRVASLLKGAE